MNSRRQAVLVIALLASLYKPNTFEGETLIETFAHDSPVFKPSFLEGS